MSKDHWLIHSFVKIFIVLLLGIWTSQSYSHDPTRDSCLGGKVQKCVCPQGTVLKDAQCKPTFKSCFKACLPCVKKVCQSRDSAQPNYISSRTACRAQRHAQCMVGFNNPEGSCGAFCSWKSGDKTCSQTTCATGKSPDPNDFCKCKQIEGLLPAENPPSYQNPPFKSCFKPCLSCVKKVCQFNDPTKPNFFPKTACRKQRLDRCMVGFNNPTGGCAAFCDWKIKDPTCANTTCSEDYSPNPNDFCKCVPIRASRGVR